MTKNKAFFYREFTCPICRLDFKSRAVRSSAAIVQERESDFHIIYQKISPLHYSIMVCPQCCYAGSATAFKEKLRPETANQLAYALKTLRQEEPDFGELRDIETALRAFQLAVQTAQLKKVPYNNLAGLLLGAGWLAREADMPELEMAYMKTALECYQKSYATEDLTTGGMDEIQLLYLIGELHRRTGKRNEAINWFNRVITHPNIKNNPYIEKLAREQWALTREQAEIESETRETVYSSGSPIEPPRAGAKTAIPTATPAAHSNRKPEQTPRARSRVKLMSRLYTDQVDWLAAVVNRCYAATHSHITREEVLRAVLDAVIELSREKGPLPAACKNEEELKEEMLTYFKKIDADDGGTTA